MSEVNPDIARQRRMEAFRLWLERVQGTGDSGLSTDEIMDMTRGPFDDVDLRHNRKSKP